MKQLTTLLATLALTSTLVAGCNRKKTEEAKDQPAATKATDDKAAPTPTPTPTGDKTAKTDDQMAAPAGDTPPECSDFKAMIDKAASCDKIPQHARDSMKHSYDAMIAGLANATPDAKAQVVSSCKQAAEGLKASAGATCGW